MEIANLQQIISQESRAGGASGGISDKYASASTTAPVVYPTLVAFNERSNSAHGPNFSSSTPTYGNVIYSQISTDAAASPILYHLLMGDFQTVGGTRATASETIYGTKAETGYTNTWLVSNNQTSYGPFMMSLMFARNPTNTAITTAMTDYTSSYWSSGYDGSGRCMYTPNSHNYASVTNCAHSSLWTSTNSSYSFGINATVTVPANQTVALMHCATAMYWTSFSSGGHWYVNYRPQTATMWSSGLVPDLKMHAAAQQLRDTEIWPNGMGETNGTAILTKIYNMAGEAFGENT